MFLITRPSYDDATTYLYYYAGLLLKEAEERGIQYIDLKRPRLTPENFTKIVKQKSPIFIFFNAHGDEKRIYGDKRSQGEDVLVEEGKNHRLLDNRLVYARACWSAASLGKACVGGCFIGYKVPFRFWHDEEWATKPLNDNVAKRFLDPSNSIVSALLKGNTAREAVEKSAMVTKKTMLKLLEEKTEPGALASIKVLWSNMDGLEVIGNQEMRLT